MNLTHFDSSGLIFVTGTVIGLAVITILALLNKDKSLEVNLLSLFIACLIVVLFANIAYQSDFFLNFPFLYRSLSFTSYCIGPLSFLYVRTTIEQSYQLKKTDAFFFLPAIGYLIHRIPFMMLPADEKLTFIKHALETSTPVMSEPEGMLPPGYAAILRIATGISFLTAQFILLVKYRNRFNSALTPLPPEAVEDNKYRYKWLFTFSTIIISGYILALVSTALQLSQNKFFGNFTSISVSMTVISISTVLFSRPKLLYGMTGWFRDNDLPSSGNLADGSHEKDSSTHASESIQRPGSLSESQRISIKGYIEQFVESSESWLSAGFSIRDMSKSIDVPLYQLSAFINQEFNKNFNEWLNDLRIDRLIKQLETDPRVRTYTLQYIGESLGFRSRTSFIAAVKKRTGKTPSDLIDGYKK